MSNTPVLPEVLQWVESKKGGLEAKAENGDTFHFYFEKRIFSMGYVIRINGLIAQKRTSPTDTPQVLKGICDYFLQRKKEGIAYPFEREVIY